jgi:hypothetical protein
MTDQGISAWLGMTSLLDFCTSKVRSSNRPCLPRIEDELGYGFDIVTGEMTQRVVRLLHEEPKIFRHIILGDFAIPSNVECQELRVRTEKASTQLFQSTMEYRVYLELQAGVVVPLGSTVSLLLGKHDLRKAKAEYFQRSRYLSESIIDEPLYIRVGSGPSADCSRYRGLRGGRGPQARNSCSYSNYDWRASPPLWLDQCLRFREHE